MRRALMVICGIGLILFLLIIYSYVDSYSKWHALSVDLREFTPADSTQAKVLQDAIWRAEPEALWPLTAAALSMATIFLGVFALRKSGKPTK